MNISITSRESILSTCRELVSKKGISCLKMRTVAEACNVAVGALYYYFPSKNDLLISVIESVWDDIFKLNDIDINKLSFYEYIEECFKNIASGIQKYPNFFTLHSVSFSAKNKKEARLFMDNYFDKMKEKMLISLRADKHIRINAFSRKFSKEEFVDFVFMNIVGLLLKNKNSCEFLLKVIYRTIY